MRHYPLSTIHSQLQKPYVGRCSTLLPIAPSGRLLNLRQKQVCHKIRNAKKTTN
ncbi:MAG: hypothetical protein LBE12_09595 [Planctomycetaceae bacterium]|nr:hypothetical protein [Planctomycetaceae bacterium]